MSHLSSVADSVSKASHLSASYFDKIRVSWEDNVEAEADIGLSISRENVWNPVDIPVRIGY